MDISVAGLTGNHSLGKQVFFSVFFLWLVTVWAGLKLVDISVDSSSGRRRLGRHAQRSLVTFILNLF